MTIVTAGGTFGKGNVVNRCHQFFYGTNIYRLKQKILTIWN